MNNFNNSELINNAHIVIEINDDFRSNNENAPTITVTKGKYAVTTLINNRLLHRKDGTIVIPIEFWNLRYSFNTPIYVVYKGTKKHNIQLQASFHRVPLSIVARKIMRFFIPSLQEPEKIPLYLQDRSFLFNVSAHNSNNNMAQNALLFDPMNSDIYNFYEYVIDTHYKVNTKRNKAHIVGNDKNNIIIGSDYNNYISGKAGNDKIHTGASADWIEGGEGNDYINGGAGNDSLHGGPGHDRLLGGDDRDVINGNNGMDNLHGGRGNDRLYGGPHMDQLYGGPGCDMLKGGKGNDYLNGGSNSDMLFGEEGNDYLDGGDGNDVLIDGEGHDIMHGGNNNDIIHLNKGVNLLKLSGDNNAIKEENMVIYQGTGCQSTQFLLDFDFSHDMFILQCFDTGPLDLKAWKKAWNEAEYIKEHYIKEHDRTLDSLVKINFMGQLFYFKSKNLPLKNNNPRDINVNKLRLYGLNPIVRTFSESILYKKDDQAKRFAHVKKSAFLLE